MRFDHPVITGVKSFAVMLLIAVLIYRPFINVLRQRYMDVYSDRFVSNIASGKESDIIEIPDSDLFSFEGEEEQYIDEEAISSELLPASELVVENTGNEDSGLQLIGVIEIPSIDTKVPVWEGVSVKALRFGVGRYPLSAELGSDKGNCFIMGHRNRHISTIFCRLQYIKTGASVYVTTKDNRRLEYKVKETVSVPPEKVADYIVTDNERARLTLCTCISEKGKGWRFMAICERSET
jgi:LPXTG-site transpeptidase (sortase) family protein